MMVGCLGISMSRTSVVSLDSGNSTSGIVLNIAARTVWQRWRDVLTELCTTEAAYFIIKDYYIGGGGGNYHTHVDKDDKWNFQVCFEVPERVCTLYF